MRRLVDLVYLVIALVTAPIWLLRMARTGKLRTDWRGRFGSGPNLPAKTRPRILLHAVSVGEVNAIRMLVDALERSSAHQTGVDIVIATTTDTGFARAQGLWQDRHPVVRYPLDFSWAVDRFLYRVDPNIVALIELEVWPNFTAACHRLGIPVCVINGRLTTRSYRRYKRISALVRPSFQRLAAVGAQNEAYACRFRSLGAPIEGVVVTGTMKWDTAQIDDNVAGADELARAMGIDRSQPLVVAGSTAPDEHKLMVSATPAGVQLLCAPRKPEWFEDAAAALPGCVRRSATRIGGPRGSPTGRFLLDSIGELRQAYALADLVVIGRSFGGLHGSDMMEPIALGKPTVVGPAVSDFQDTVDALLAGGGIVQTTVVDLPSVLRELLAEPERCELLASRGRAVIRANQGATERSAAILLSLLAALRPSKNPPSRRKARTAVEEKEERQ